jgi:hypothetical protein
MTVRFVERLVFLLLVTALFAWVAMESAGFPRLSRIFPRTVATVALVLCGVELVRMVVARILAVRRSSSRVRDEGPSLLAQFREAGPYLAWFLAYYLAIYVLGFVVASALFVMVFVTVLGGVRWYLALLSTAALITFLLVFGDALNLHWPGGLVEGWLGIDLP